MSTRYPWLDGKYCGQGFCVSCRWELPRKLYWFDGDRLCTGCYELAAGARPPRPRTIHDLPKEKS